ncbi:TPA: type II toxin-antitoxin system RelE/ParE family toxin [Photobacterium damselae]
MRWTIKLVDGVDVELHELPVKIKARMFKLLELMQDHGSLGSPHTEPMGDGLFEIRAKAQEGIGRGLYCYAKGQNIYVLRVFVKKTQKTPKNELKIARDRMKEVNKL